MSDEETLSLASDVETKASTRKRRRYCKDQHPVWAVLCGAVVIVASVAFAGLAVRISKIETQNGSIGELPSDPYKRALALLTDYPPVDGHNDLADAIRMYFENQLDKVDLSKNETGFKTSWQTDIPRLRAGKVGGQFWSAYMSCSTQYKDATRTFIDQMDVVKQFVQKYPDTFQFATTAADMEDAVAKGKIASLIGVEGGHAIDSSLGTLRQLYDLGARYMTLTHFCNTPWEHSLALRTHEIHPCTRAIFCRIPRKAHSSRDTSPNGLTDFGRRVVLEMNRIGMLVDISHVNNYTMMDVLDTSVAPVIFSHSSAYALCNDPRNVPDNVLKRMPANGGIVMVNFFPRYVNCSPNASLAQVADHIDYIKTVAGINHVGVGSDFDGIDLVPVGLEDVSKYPYLFAELIRRGYSDSDVMKVSRLNIIRVLEAAEKMRDELKDYPPDNTHISPQPNATCRPDF